MQNYGEKMLTPLPSSCVIREIPFQIDFVFIIRQRCEYIKTENHLKTAIYIRTKPLILEIQCDSSHKEENQVLRVFKWGCQRSRKDFAFAAS